ncbi:MAG TPA: cytochrome c-type biogenesis protein [Steroidobacteraceae bacterium]
MNRARVVLLVLLLATSPCALAVDSVTLADPAQQARYLALTHEIRCVVCQGESIADSNADLAADFRRQVREMLIAGKSDQEVRDYMVARYGESILYKPPFNVRTAWLWLAPGILLIVGAIVAVRIQRQRAALVDQDNEPLEEDVRS